MTSLNPVRVARPVQPARPVKAQAPVEPAGKKGIALPADEATRIWAENEAHTMLQATPARLRALLVEGPEKLQGQGLSARTRARVHLVISGAHGLLAGMGESQIGNGKGAYRHCEAAFRADPTWGMAASGFGRTLAAFTDLSWGKRKFVEVGLGISTEAEARRVLPALARHPNDAVAQLTRQKLAKWVGDDAAAAAAAVAIARLPAASVAAARKELASDNEQAKKAKE